MPTAGQTPVPRPAPAPVLPAHVLGLFDHLSDGMHPDLKVEWGRETTEAARNVVRITSEQSMAFHTIDGVFAIPVAVGVDLFQVTTEVIDGQTFVLNAWQLDDGRILPATKHGQAVFWVAFGR